MNGAGSAIVMGAGFGGMAAALRLKAMGHDVLLLEKNEQLGGRAQVLEHKGLKYDAGPTVITAPFLIDELFALFGKKTADYVDIRPIEPWYRFQDLSGARLDYSSDTEALKAAIAEISPDDAGRYDDFARASKKIYELGFESMAHRPFERVADLVKFLPHLVRLRSDKSVYGFISSYFKHPLVRRAFSLQPLLVGGDPTNVTSIYVLIHWLERRYGVHHAMGGMGALVDALERLMVEEGIEVRTGARVTKILTKSGRTVGVELEDGTQEKADIVVSNLDPSFLYSKLVPVENRKKWTDRRIAKMKPSIGTYLLYFSTDRRHEDVAQHTIILGERYRETLKDIFKRQVLPEDPSVYLHRPTANDPGFAPEGVDVFYALAPVPALEGKASWPEQGEAFREVVLDLLEQTSLPGLRGVLRDDFHVTPKYFQSRFDAYRGSGFSIAPSLTQSACFRFHNRSEDLEGLYLTGAGTHPGAGIPGVLSSAKVVENLLKGGGPS
jgi:phytoene desaturase